MCVYNISARGAILHIGGYVLTRFVHKDANKEGISYNRVCVYAGCVYISNRWPHVSVSPPVLSVFSLSPAPQDNPHQPTTPQFIYIHTTFRTDIQ